MSENESESDRNTALILEKLENLPSKDLLHALQGQMVTDKGEILAKLAELRSETRTEIASLRVSNDTTNLALNQLDGRVKKIESRSMPPRYSSNPTMKAVSLGSISPGQKELVDRLNELEADLHGVLSERDEAKREAFLAQERQGAVQKYANDKEKEAREAKEKSDAAVEAAEREAEKKAAKARKDRDDAAAASQKKLDRMILLAKLLAAAIPIAAGLMRWLH